ncbi:hypothetical protein E2562_007756 [Oryza meyeriana var. granulata]|uniref:Bifunctional inhibitor/plant lipid transfer protein/seed storage helical domain-containing protein n=1 Tax=Oryza meyeriana var. granulata TaxID=110450 RepID=A0A6G1EFQ6_9ORYZ|nr:hypothetical protein E2562_007756 [Oryza meyeriana var. granulata]
MVVATVMLVLVAVAAAPGASAAITACEQVKSLATPCIPLLNGTAGCLTDDCCSGVRDLYKVSEDEVGFLCLCLKSSLQGRRIPPRVCLGPSPRRLGLGLLHRRPQLFFLDMKKQEAAERACSQPRQQRAVARWWSSTRSTCQLGLEKAIMAGSEIYGTVIDSHGAKGEDGRPRGRFSHAVRRLDEFYAHATVRGWPTRRVFSRWPRGAPPPEGEKKEGV